MTISKHTWWKGQRGEWYVVLQLTLFALILFGPRTAFGLSWPASMTAVSMAVGGALFALGCVVSSIAVFHLGSNLTPLPHPKDDATLVLTGLYRLVRHPIYFGVILMAFGWALLVQGWLTLAYAVVLAVFFDIKTRREEIWLARRFPQYAAYRTRVKKLIPFVY